MEGGGNIQTNYVERSRFAVGTFNVAVVMVRKCEPDRDGIHLVVLRHTYVFPSHTEYLRT